MKNNPNGGPKDIYEFIEEYINISNEGYIKSHRANDTGVGKTLEDLLGIKENDIQGPDFADYELKAHRINKGTTMISLFTRAPDAKGTNNRLREEYGYKKDPNCKYKELHSTLSMYKTTGKSNLGLDIIGNRLFITSFGKPISYAYYDLDGILQSLKSKYVTGKAVFAGAEARGSKSNEEFHYLTAELATGMSTKNFIKLLKEGKIKLDLRLGVYKSGKNEGKLHDHGTGFRIFPKDEELLFDNLEDLIAEYKNKINK